MYTTTSTSNKDLKKGQRVLFYGEVFIIDEDAVEIKNHNNSGRSAYFAKCHIENKITRQTNISGLLNNYDGFQGNEDVKRAVITG